jgi:hypothetical protein
MQRRTLTIAGALCRGYILGETKQFFHFIYSKDINFHDFSIAIITKPDFPRLVRCWKTPGPISKT